MLEEKANFTIPAAIVIACVLVAGAILLTRGGDDNTAAVGAALNKEVEVIVRSVDESDHILGNPKADIVIIEYADTECPFCKNFHLTMRRLMDEYGKTGKVAWVYRHFPLEQLHTKAKKEAEATECAGFLGSEEKFWAYLNRIYEVTPSNDGLDLARLPFIAEEVGLDFEEFEACVMSNKFTADINKSYDEGLKAGARGTPYSIIVTKNGDKMPIEGAQPYESVKAIIESLLKGK